jgi:hypothetical protein
MALIRISDERRRNIQSWARALGMRDVCVLIRKRGAVANLTNGAEGDAVWSIDRSEPWRAELVSRAAVPTEHVSEAGGIAVYAPELAEHAGPPLELSFSDGELHVYVAT